MMNKKWILIGLLFQTFSFGYTQSKKDIRNYHYSKELLKKGQYKKAISIFGELYRNHPQTKLASYALYFNALSSFHIHDLQESKSKLYELIARDPEWKKNQEAFYLLSVIAYQEREMIQSYAYLEEVRGKTFFKKKTLLKMDIANRLDFETLKKIYYKNPQDSIIGRTLLRVIESHYKIQFNHHLLYNRLKRQYSLRREKKITSKKTYGIAVMLPFLLDSTTSVQMNNSKVALDLYRGVKIAIEGLVDKEFHIQLFAFDTENDESKIEAILSSSEMKKIDIVVGPLYIDFISKFSQFGEKFEKTIISPLSRKEDILNSGENTYTLFPTYTTQGKMAADFAIDFLANDTAKIIYDRSIPKNRSIALAFKERYEERGKYVKLFYEFNDDPSSFDNLFDTLSVNSLKDDVLTQIFICSTDFTVSSNIFSALKNLKNASSIITMSEWLSFDQFTYKQMEYEDIYFIYPDFIKKNTADYKNFYKMYVVSQKMLPSIYAFIGYELVHFLVRRLNKKSLNTDQNLFREKEEFYYPAMFLSGFKHGKNKDNQVVPIVKFVDGNLQIVNQLQFQFTKK